MMEEIRDTREKGWFWAENALIDREDIGAYEKLIYMTLSRFADSSGKCFPGLDLLMKKCSIGNKGTLRKHLASMEEKGLIEIVKRSGKGNIYYLKNIKDEPEPKSTSTESVQGTDLGMPKSGKSTLTKNGQTPCTDLDRHLDQKWSPKETQEGNTIKKTQLTKHNRVKKEPNEFALVCEEIKAKWVETASEFELAGTQLKINDKRKNSIRTLLKEYNKNEIIQAIDRIRLSSFLRGKNKNSWQVSFDWITNKTNLLKVLEGNYDDKEQVMTAKKQYNNSNNNDFTVTEEGLKKFYGYE